MSGVITAPYPGLINNLKCTALLDYEDDICGDHAPWVEEDQIAGTKMGPGWIGEAWCDIHRPELTQEGFMLE